ncbi:ABC transporter substrate-binding protein [Haladaptatus paucihalophilus]|uniref:Substrate-binding protein n=2 Tax=Haladaptatus paucihalophilus DX253 TaxID=797209 RepID=A0A1M6SGR9_HALPU|nr:ABC transporter substrate-binding protein [Haladaptatus paucihalophilus]SHK43869.1 substrate-binding protein [Haladaptatus paucihalophilus DX253]
MSQKIDRRAYLRAAGAATTVGLMGTLQQGGGPDMLTVIGYPESGIQLFRDFYATGRDVPVLVPDGLQSSSLPKEVGNNMQNVTGTAPAAAGPNQQAFTKLFRDRYDSPPGVFTAQSYDSVAILILANAAAGENDGQKIRDQMRRVANPPGTEYGPENLVDAVKAAANGEDINYQGASSSTNFDANGDPASAAYDVWKFAPQTEDGIRVVNTRQFQSNAGGPEANNAPGGLGRTIRVGILLPQTGDLASVGGPMIQASRIPIQQVNEGNVDLQVETQVEDTQTARQASLSGANALVNAGFPAISGPASSGNNIPVASEVFIPNQIVGCSPSSTAITVTRLQDDDYIFRTAPSDLLQGGVMAQVAGERIGAQSAATLYVNNDYGQQLSNQFAQKFQQDQGGNVTNQVAFNKGESSYSSVIQQALG